MLLPALTVNQVASGSRQYPQPCIWYFMNNPSGAMIAYGITSSRERWHQVS